MMTQTWQVEIFIGEREGSTHAEARLVNRDNTPLTGYGDAKLSPSDHDVPEIGDELAVSRALADLAHKLLDTTSGDIEGVTHEHVHLTR